jgi:hypothetical protein
MTHANRTRVAAVLLVAGLTAVAGCGSADKPSVTKSDGGVTAHTTGGAVTAGEKLPVGFPTADVPVLDEKVLSGVKGGAGGNFAWSVVQQTSRAVEDVTAEVKKDYAAAGYTTRQADVMGDVSILHFAGAKYDVRVTAARTGSSVTVTYLVKDAA